jgi:glycine cleavage system H lipoate-binding protein
VTGEVVEVNHAIVDDPGVKVNAEPMGGAGSSS